MEVLGKDVTDTISYQEFRKFACFMPSWQVRVILGQGGGQGRQALGGSSASWQVGFMFGGEGRVGGGGKRCKLAGEGHAGTVWGRAVQAGR